MNNKKSLKFFIDCTLLVISTFTYLLLVCPLLSIYRFFFLGKDKLKKTSTKQIVYFSSVQWFDVWQRPQHCVSGLSKNFQVFYISPLPFHHIFSDIKGWLKKRIFEYNKELIIYSPILFSGENKSHFVRLLNRMLTVGYMTELFVKYKISNPVIWMNNPFHAYIIEKFSYKFVVYDIMDEYIKFSIAPRDVQKLEDLILKKSKVVFTGTNALFKEKKRYHSNISFVPCGVDFEMFNSADKISRSDLPENISKINHPIIGYIGGLNERIDTELIEYIAEKKENWNIILVGPVQRSFNIRKKHDNILFTGLKPYKELPKYISKFDVAILPYKISDATYFINPVKLLEYMAAGKPVVSVPIPDIIEFYSDKIELAEDYESFAEKIEKLLSFPDKKKIRDGIELAKTKTWESMVNDMLNKIEKLISL